MALLASSSGSPSRRLVKPETAQWNLSFAIRPRSALIFSAATPLISSISLGEAVQLAQVPTKGFSLSVDQTRREKNDRFEPARNAGTKNDSQACDGLATEPDTCSRFWSNEPRFAPGHTRFPEVNQTRRYRIREPACIGSHQISLRQGRSKVIENNYEYRRGTSIHFALHPTLVAKDDPPPLAPL